MRIILKIKRLERKLSQNDLADLVGVTNQSISNYETNKATPSYEVMKKIADSLGSSVEELFSDEASI